VSPAGNSDNIFLSVAPGATQHYTVYIPKNHPPGTDWYHSHLHHLSYGQVSAGMSGMIVVEGIEKLLPKPLQNITQHYFWMKDFPFDQLFLTTHTYVNQLSNTNTGTEMLNVNGEVNPTINIKSGETQLWRFANIGPENYYVVEWPGHKFHVISEDGSPVWKVNDTNTLFMPSGKRFDVLVTATGNGSVPLRLANGNYTEPYDSLVANINIQGNQKDMKPVNSLEQYIPTSLWNNMSTLGYEKDLSNATIAAHRVLNFSSDDTNWIYKIDNKTFNPNRINQIVKLGTVEEWKLRNLDTVASGNDHPFHIHVNDFQVISVNGKPYHANGYQDTVLIPANGEVVIRIPFEDFLGKSVYHCHLMFHGDYGMMGIFEVVK
jgi:suppressor of ftsI